MQIAVGVLFFPGVKLTGSNVVAPAQFSRAGNLTEQLLNKRSFKILSKPSSFHSKGPFASFQEAVTGS